MEGLILTLYAFMFVPSAIALGWYFYDNDVLKVDGSTSGVRSALAGLVLGAVWPITLGLLVFCSVAWAFVVLILAIAKR